MLKISAFLLAALLLDSAEEATSQQDACLAAGFPTVPISTGQWNELEASTGITLTQPVKTQLTGRLCMAISDLRAQKSTDAQKSTEFNGTDATVTSVMAAYLNGFVERGGDAPPVEAVLFESFGASWTKGFSPQQLGRVRVVSDTPLDVVVIRGEPRPFAEAYAVLVGHANFRGLQGSNVVCQEDLQVLKSSWAEFRCEP